MHGQGSGERQRWEGMSEWWVSQRLMAARRATMKGWGQQHIQVIWYSPSLLRSSVKNYPHFCSPPYPSFSATVTPRTPGILCKAMHSCTAAPTLPTRPWHPVVLLTAPEAPVHTLWTQQPCCLGLELHLTPLFCLCALSKALPGKPLCPAWTPWQSGRLLETWRDANMQHFSCGWRSTLIHPSSGDVFSVLRSLRPG